MAIVITGETYVNSGTLAFSVDVQLMTAITVVTLNDGVGIVKPNAFDISDIQVLNLHSNVVYVAGLVAAPGEVLKTEGNGGIPISYNGTLLTNIGGIVVGDLFG